MSDEQKTSILLVEDEENLHEALKLNLELEGYDVTSAFDGAAALNAITGEYFDLIILDVMLPEMDGITAAKLLTQEKVAPVLLLTAYSDREFVEGALDAGVMGYIVKPFREAELVPAIELALARFREFHALEKELGDTREVLETRKLVDRAKGVLQKQLQLSEPDAFRWIQKTAMDLRLSMRQVAEGVIAHGPKLS